MTIVSSSVVFDPAGPDGRKQARETHTDHLGNVYVRGYLWDSGIDANAVLAARAEQIESELAEAEAQALLG